MLIADEVPMSKPSMPVCAMKPMAVLVSVPGCSWVISADWPYMLAHAMIVMVTTNCSTRRIPGSVTARNRRHAPAPSIVAAS